MKKLREIYETFETDEETLLVEKIMNEDKELAEKHLSQCNAVVEIKQFKSTFTHLEVNIFPNIFISAIRALGGEGWILNELLLIKLKTYRNKSYLSACVIFVNRQQLLLTIAGNIYTLKLEVEISCDGVSQNLKEYEVADFSEEKLEDQIITFLKGNPKRS